MEPSYEDVIALCMSAGDAAYTMQPAARAVPKSDGSPMTEADRACNEIISSGLKKSGIPVLSEESPESFLEHGKGRVWILDPIDGTSGFIEGTAEWAVMLALLEDGAPIFGVVYAPALGGLWHASRGEGAFRRTKNGDEKISVSRTNELKSARLFLSKHHVSKQAEALAAALGVVPIHQSGLGIKVCKIAQGEADMYWSEAHLGEWDACAPQLILQEAGGTMTDAVGEAIVYGSKDERHIPGVAASNALLHASLVEAGRHVIGV